MANVLACVSISKTYGFGTLAESVLKNVSISLEQGQTCVLVGPSGSGKTTLLSILGCLLSPTSGELTIHGFHVSKTSLSGLAGLRRMLIGFVFQHAQLLPFLNVHDNLAIVGANSGMPCKVVASRIAELSLRLDIQSIRHKRPEQISGGQRQRVAIARALLHRPKLILADEPTAALDWENGQRVVRLLTEQAKRDGAALITVTHDTRLLNMFDRVLQIDSGLVKEQLA